METSLFNKIIDANGIDRTQKVVDLGCGVFKDLEKVFFQFDSFEYNKKRLIQEYQYIGIDSDVRAENFNIFIQDLPNIDSSIIEKEIQNRFALSLGLTCCLTDLKKIKLLNLINKGIIQFLRNDSLEGIQLQLLDYLQFNLPQYPVSLSSLKEIIHQSNLSIVYMDYTPVSYIVYLERE